MASTLPYVSREEMDEIEQELRRAGPRGESPDLDALQCTILLDLIAEHRASGEGSRSLTPNRVEE